MQTSLTARSALRAQQTQLDTIANNIANINTAGYKSSSVNFKDTLYSAITRASGAANTRLQNGTGVRVGAVTRSFADGAPVPTGNLLDACLTGDGFFTVQTAGGETRYTRNGSFQISTQGGTRYLMTADGSYVMGTSGKITVPNGDLSTFQISADGKLTINQSTDSTSSSSSASSSASASSSSFATLKISTFDNRDGLEAAGNTSFRATDASGAAKTVEKPELLQGYQESSNVDLPTEMTTLIRAQKAFAFASQVVKAADEMDATANNMRT